MKKKGPRNPLIGKKATVSLHRNGLSISIDDVPAIHAATVAGTLLLVARKMAAGGFEEMVQDAGTFHAGSLGEVPDDDADTETRKRPIGFTST